MSSTLRKNDGNEGEPLNQHAGRRCQFLLETDSTDVQEETEEECMPFFIPLSDLKKDQLEHLRQVGLMDENERKICLLYDRHENYLRRPLTSFLQGSFVSLDSSRPWILYWTLHALDVMGRLPENDHVLIGIVSTIKACWQSFNITTLKDTEEADELLKEQKKEHSVLQGGGFGGGPGQMAHCATTYAAVLALCIVAASNRETRSTKMARELLSETRLPLYAWFLSLKQESGGFSMHYDGEVDVRATYTIVACASLLNLVTPALAKNVPFYVSSCQTYEGGFGGEFQTEAHGGYTFCALAALSLLNKMDVIDVPALRGWLARRQMSCEGGFAGRSNKLVDGCYSFWQGGSMVILSHYYNMKQTASVSNGCGYYYPQQDYWLLNSSAQDGDYQDVLLFDEAMLQRYILLCAQDVNGGLRDKPSKPRDFYHSCYNISGLSASQHWGSLSYGHPKSSAVEQTHPCFNIRTDRVRSIVQHFFSDAKT